MTSTEIKQKQAMELSERDWLREVAFQLALLNEKPPAISVADAEQLSERLSKLTTPPITTGPKRRY